MIWLVLGIIAAFVLNFFAQDMFYETNVEFYRVVSRSNISYATRRRVSSKYRDGVL